MNINKDMLFALVLAIVSNSQVLALKSNEVFNQAYEVESIWAPKEHNQALSFTLDLINLIKNKDLNSISKLVSYPIIVRVKTIEGQKEISINNALEFSSHKFEDIFTPELVDSILGKYDLFDNYQGFMIGEDGGETFGLVPLKRARNSEQLL